MNTKLLRQKILDLAIRGKLTEQKKSDGTTKDLLAQISKQWLVSSKQDSQKENASSNVIANTTSTSSRTPIRDPFAASKNSDDVIASTAKQSKKKTFAPKEIIPLDKSEAPFEIPENWEWVRLGDVCTINQSNQLDDDLDVAFVPMTNVAPGYANTFKQDVRKWGEIKKGFTHFANGDIAVAKITPCFENRKSVLFKDLKNGYGAGTTELHILRPSIELNRLFLLWFVKTDFFIQHGIGNFSGAVGQQRVGKDVIANIAFPLPPLAEQKRIVEAIESAFAEITAIENNQELLKKHIKQGRQKILDLAIRGRLTQQLKTDGTTKDLLAQISKQWLVSSKQESQKENASFNVIASATSTSSRTPIRDPFAASKNSDNVIASTAKQSKKNKTAEPKQIIPLDKSEAPFEIPENWEWVKYGDVVTNISVKENQVKSSEIHSEGLYPVVSQGQNYVDGFVDDFSKIIHLGNIPIVLFGDHTRVVKYIDFDFVVGADGTKVLKPLTIVMPKYLYYSTMAIVEKIEDRGYGRHYALLSNSMFALPPLAEQQRIVAAIESAFTEFDAMEKGIL